MARPMIDVLNEVATWDSVADELKRRGIEGQRNCGRTCPMAQYLIGETSRDEVEKIYVDGFSTTWWDKDNNEHMEINPKNMTRFIADFDDGEIPELDTDPIDPDDDWDEDWDYDYWGEDEDEEETEEV